jgi:Protein of unknown function (DUF1439)
MIRRMFLLACAAGGATSAQSTSITVAEADLQRLVERQFPLSQRYGEALDVTYSNPVLRVLGERGRLAATVDVAARDRLFGNRWRGRLALDALPRYEAADHSVRLRQVHVQRFEVDEPLAPLREQIERLGPGLAESLLEDVVVYTVPDEQLATLALLGLEPGDVTVTPRGVEIRLVPRR